MKQKLTLILLCLAVGISGAFTSCKNDAPDIVAKTETTYKSDFSGITKALQDQTLSIDEKLDLLKLAIDETEFTLFEKLGLIELAVENGVATYQECATNLIAAINKLNDNQAAKLEAIREILLATNVTLELKLANIEAAIKAGIGTYADFARQLIDAINELNQVQADKIQEIYNVLESSFASIATKVELVKLAIENGFISNQKAVDALNEAIVVQLKYNQGELGKSIDEITKALTGVNNSINFGFYMTDATMGLVVKNLTMFLKSSTKTVNGALDAIEAAIYLLNLQLYKDGEKILDLLKQIKEAILKGNDYSGLIAAIKGLIPQPGREAVDLGLSVDWATCNLGAEKPEEFGDMYGWGMVNPYAPDVRGINWKLYWTSLGSSGTSEWTCGGNNDPLKNFIKSGICGTEWDAAVADWEGDWRMPSADELNELVKNTKAEWTTVNGVDGMTFSKDGKSIFLLAAGFLNGTQTGAMGCYASGSSFSPYACSYLVFGSKEVLVYCESRYHGLSIRPVKVK